MTESRQFKKFGFGFMKLNYLTTIGLLKMLTYNIKMQYFSNDFHSSYACLL